MARIRSVKPELWSDEKLAEVPRAVRLTFIGLISACADDAGRLKGNPRVIRGAVYPLDDDISVEEISRHLEQLAGIKVIQRYAVNGEQYIQIVNWKKHQKINRVTPSRLPSPHGGRSEDAVRVQGGRDGERSGAEMEMDEEKERSGARAREAPSPLPDPDPLDLQEQHPAPPAPRVVLPPYAKRLVDELYGLSTPKRRLDVTAQLYDTLDPERRGARLRKGVHVRARDAPHLDSVCRDVLMDPPRDTDMAVVIVLQKLLDPPPGPSPAEIVAKRESEERALEEQYAAAARQAGLAWMRSHPEEYEVLRKPIDAQFTSGGNSAFVQQARSSALATATARAAGFPSFDEWVAQRNGGQVRHLVPEGVS
jgi:hypothetical protein